MIFFMLFFCLVLLVFVLVSVLLVVQEFVFIVDVLLVVCVVIIIDVVWLVCYDCLFGYILEVIVVVDVVVEVVVQVCCEEWQIVCVSQGEEKLCEWVSDLFCLVMLDSVLVNVGRGLLLDSCWELVEDFKLGLF